MRNSFFKRKLRIVYVSLPAIGVDDFPSDDKQSRSVGSDGQIAAWLPLRRREMWKVVGRGGKTKPHTIHHIRPNSKTSDLVWSVEWNSPLMSIDGRQNWQRIRNSQLIAIYQIIRLDLASYCLYITCQANCDNYWTRSYLFFIKTLILRPFHRRLIDDCWHISNLSHLREFGAENAFAALYNLGFASKCPTSTAERTRNTLRNFSSEIKNVIRTNFCWDKLCGSNTSSLSGNLLVDCTLLVIINSVKLVVVEANVKEQTWWVNI